MTRAGIIAFMLILLARVCAAQQVVDLRSAMEWCDVNMLQGPEGIWEFPEDGTRVIIRHKAGFDDRFELLVIDSPDTRLSPGDIIGSLNPSPVSTKFEMSLCRNRMNGILSDPGHCLAEYNANDDAILISTHKVKLKFSPRWILPAFWRSLRISSKDPLENLPRGLRRIYPTPRPRRIDYL